MLNAQLREFLDSLLEELNNENDLVSNASTMQREHNRASNEGYFHLF